MVPWPRYTPISHSHINGRIGAGFAQDLKNYKKWLIILNKLGIFLNFWSWINLTYCFYLFLYLCLFFRQTDIYRWKSVGHDIFFKIVHKFIHRLRGQNFCKIWPRIVSMIRQKQKARQISCETVANPQQTNCDFRQSPRQVTSPEPCPTVNVPKKWMYGCRQVCSLIPIHSLSHDILAQ